MINLALQSQGNVYWYWAPGGKPFQVKLGPLYWHDSFYLQYSQYECTYVDRFKVEPIRLYDLFETKKDCIMHAVKNVQDDITKEEDAIRKSEEEILNSKRKILFLKKEIFKINKMVD